MGITASQAAEIARRYGLTLQDAAGLATLADTVEEAEQLAASFSIPDGQGRRSARHLRPELLG